MINVAIADDHRLFADGLAEALGGLPDINVVGVAYDGAQLIAMLNRQRTDIAIVDLEMPIVDGIQVLETIASRVPSIVVTMHADAEQRARAAEAGAAGFLSKSTPLPQLAAAIRAAASGERFAMTTTLRDLLEPFQEPVLDPGARLLTSREREILALLGRGVTATEELANRLFISKKTVKNHLASIFAKLDVSDRAQAAVEAIRLGIAPRW
ncbi:MAG: response regulator transcription factor [Actinobacteria bacterium]|nr:response regulator transcription factor [Actinomycetota bacterium]